LFELRVHADNQVNDLVVYTTATQWTMPQAMWAALAADSAGVPMTVSVRGAVYAGGAITALAQGSSGPFGIAPVEAPGAIVYWQITGGSQGDLLGFNVGDDTVQNTMLASTVKEYSTQCVGCHTSTPDGDYAVFSSNSATNTWDDGIGSVKADAGVGDTPSFLSADGKTALQGSSQGIMATSIAHWSPGDYMVLAASNSNTTLQWTELDGVGAAATGTMTITGDPNANKTSPTWSHDGKNVAYTSAPQSVSGRPSGANNDIYVVPYSKTGSVTAKALTGANTAANEYYPSYSPDDQWITFNRTTDGDTYSQPNAEVYVTKADGSGTAQRLAANDPPACSKRVSPGVTNSWPRWAPAKPAPQTVNGLTYYWVVFSSKRLDGSTPQLYMAPVVIDATGKVQQYQAVYLWNQPSTEHNHTPAWDVFAIPPQPGGPPR
jgi:Tol biopolymer transport system component